MEFTIISIGSSELLTEVLNGLAMIMGTGDVDRAAGTALLAFCLWSGVKYTMNPSSGMPWAQCLVGMIMFACFFGPSVTVVVEDAYSGKTTVTDNIPVGPAAAGSFLSHVGYGLTQIMEQGYGTVTDTGRVSTGGFVDPLKSLVALRREDVRNMSFKLADQELPSIYDSRKTVENYMRYCTARKPGLEGESAMKDVMSDQLPDALYLNSSYYTTMVMDSVTGTLKTCKEAQADISTIYSKITDSSSIERAFQTLSGTNTSAEDTGTDSRMVRLQDFLASFSATTAANTKDLFAAGIMYPLMEAARAGHLKDGKDLAASAAINSAIQTRNAQWAYEGSSFLQTMRPMMAILEAIVYAISPIAAIIVVMGSAGMAMVGKYMQMIFWLQLWMPMMSIINLYSINSAAEKFYQMTGYDSEMQLGSFYAFNNYSTMAEAYTSTAGMMLGAVPLLAMMIATGSIYTLNSLAGRMTSPDTFDEGRISANPGKAPTLLNQAPISSFDQASGLSATGASSGLGSYNVSQIASSAHSRAQSRSSESTTAFGKALTASLANTATRSATASMMDSASHSNAYTSSEGYSRAQQLMSSMTQSMGLTTSQSEALQSAVAMKMAGGLKGDLGNFGSAGMTGSFSDQFSSQEEYSDNFNKLYSQMQNSSFSEQDQASLTTGFQQGWTETAATSNQSSQTNSMLGALNKTATQAYKDSLTAQSTQSIASSYGQANSVTREQAAMRILNDQEANAGLNQVFDAAAAKNPLMREAMQRERDHLTSGPNGVNSEKAETIAKFSALTGLKNYSSAADGSYANNISSLQNTGVMTAAFGDTFNPGQTATVPDSITPTETNGQTNAGIVGEASAATSGVQTFSSAGFNSTTAAANASPTDMQVSERYGFDKEETKIEEGGKLASETRAKADEHLDNALSQPMADSPAILAGVGELVSKGVDLAAIAANPSMAGTDLTQAGERVAPTISPDKLQQFAASAREQREDAGFWSGMAQDATSYFSDTGGGSLSSNLARMPEETRAAYSAMSPEDQEFAAKGFAQYASGQAFTKSMTQSGDNLLDRVNSWNPNSEDPVQKYILAKTHQEIYSSDEKAASLGATGDIKELSENAQQRMIDSGISPEKAAETIHGIDNAIDSLTTTGAAGAGGQLMRYSGIAAQLELADKQDRGDLFGETSNVVR